MSQSHLGFFSRAFSSLAISCVLTLACLLALFLGGVQDSRAEGVVSVAAKASAGSASLASWNALEGGLSSRASSAAMLASSPRVTSKRLAVFRDQQSPLKENFGVSKLAFPLLVSDLISAEQGTKSVVMSGRTVGVR